MSAVKHTTIPKNVSSQNDLDFHFLKKKGIEYIESLGGNFWTDYNTHDPGVTVLDLLCYAITDLGNRIELPIENLLARQNATGFEAQFYTAREILPNRPVTALDYRKLFIDINGVRNCWLRPHQRRVYVNCKDNQLSYDPDAYPGLLQQFRREFDFKGLYDVLIDFDIPEDLDKESDEYKDQVIAISQAVRERYHENRNLCEDLIDINEIETQGVSVCASIELERDADEERVHAEILFTIQRYFAPAVNFYSLKEMLARGFRTDQIFEGPVLEHGFIDTDELRDSSLRTEVRLSDIMNIISSIEGVKVIKDITIGHCDGKETDEWLICIQDQKRPVLCKNSVFSYSKDVLPLVLTQTRVDAFLAEFRNELLEDRIFSGMDMDPVLPAGKFLDTDWYTTIQNDLPETYGVGQSGLPGMASAERKAQAMQLKAYLLFFDQVLATYFAQLGAASDLLSYNSDLKRTYYTQAVQDIRDLDQLIDTNDYPMEDSDLLSAGLLGSLDKINDRRNNLLDHLIARFAEKFSEYTFLMKELYGTAATEMVVKSKQEFLKDYKIISRNRGGAFNYYRQDPADLWNTTNVSGAEERIARLVGFKEKSFMRRNVSSSFVEIYPFIDGTLQVYRWRVRNEAWDIILTSTDDYHSIHAASAELNLAMLHIIQTSEQTVQEGFPDFGDNVEVGNLLIRESPEGQLSFDVINKEATPPNYVIARQYSYYQTMEELRDGMLEIIRFAKYRFSEEGIFIVEHMLLRPEVHDKTAPFDQFLPVSLDEGKDCACVDPYSYRISIVLPGYTQRFANMEFRDFMEELIREEIPAHILPKICWIGERLGQVPDAENELVTFERTYKEFLLDLTDAEQVQDPVKLKNLMDAMTDLHTIYPTGRLYDCNDMNDIEGKIIIGRTNLGTL
jgi:uncharacterized protein